MTAPENARRPMRAEVPVVGANDQVVAGATIDYLRIFYIVIVAIFVAGLFFYFFIKNKEEKVITKPVSKVIVFRESGSFTYNFKPFQTTEKWLYVPKGFECLFSVSKDTPHDFFVRCRDENKIIKIEGSNTKVFCKGPFKFIAGEKAVKITLLVTKIVSN